MYLIDPELVASQLDRSRPPRRQVVDMAIDDQREIRVGEQLHRLRLTGIEDRRDSTQGALTDSRVRLVLDETYETWLSCGTYHMPQCIGDLRLDCLATSTYVRDSDHNKWGLARDALLRIWPATGSLLGAPCQYPLSSVWLHSQSQIASETLYVNGYVPPHGLYYHAPIDIGGFEGEPVLASCDGLILSVGEDLLPGCEGLRQDARADALLLLDGRGWIHKYAHLRSFAAELAPGMHLGMGQRLGELGKAGGSGGWSHLHYKVLAQMPSGDWGNEDFYAYLLESWAVAHEAKLLACARPHRSLRVGERVVLSARNTWAAPGADPDFVWMMPDGTPAFGREVIWTATGAGTFTATVHVEDGRGNSDRDTTIIQVVEPEVPTLTVHAALWPCNRVRVGEAVTVSVRSFNNPEATGEQIDFGDTSDPVTVFSDGNREPEAAAGYATASHRYVNAGKYLIEVSCARADGQTARVHLTVIVV